MSHGAFWYEGEYKGERIGFTVVVSLLFIWIFCLCFREYCLGCTTYWRNVCKYKEAKVIPLQVAVVTQNPADSIAFSTHINDVYIIKSKN
ncbi:MAG: hypothetical protein CXT73_07610 [Methanobacteriota archaeon]|nr:MAG: hypothetical protein CXT73_07610 [Euryarchaeota archaeon]